MDYERLGRFSDALEVAQRIVRIAPDAIAHANVGVCLNRLSCYADALVSARAANSLNPDYPGAYEVAGFALQGLNRHEAALNEYQRLLDLNTSDVEAIVRTLANMGDAYLKLGRNEDAVSSLLKAVDLKAEQPDLRHLLGVAHFRMGNREAALRELQIVLKLDPLFEGELMKLLDSKNNLGSIGN